ncbi:hypothetical protein ATO49_20470 [Mycolicibacterium fortuitum subsp. fortuitum DSM 46621 = ATCC 6841 = JCM 6387]|nr:hypothetical protein ATO49_20470 [Mycolicibacterium fortuitum subsp. fortuitum DSM 46621 = ATCC 6841 = JCM 6387]
MFSVTENIAASMMPTIGTPELRAHTTMVRPMMPGASRDRRRPRLQRLGGNRPQCELGEQMAADRYHDAGKADAQQELRNVVGVGEPVQRGQQRGAHTP